MVVMLLTALALHKPHSTPERGFWRLCPHRYPAEWWSPSGQSGFDSSRVYFYYRYSGPAMAVPAQKGCGGETVRCRTPHTNASAKKLTRKFFFREMQLFLISFIVVEICEIFTVGGFPLDDAVRKVRLKKKKN